MNDDYNKLAVAVGDKLGTLLDKAVMPTGMTVGYLMAFAPLEDVANMSMVTNLPRHKVIEILEQSLAQIKAQS